MRRALCVLLGCAIMAGVLYVARTPYEAITPAPYAAPGCELLLLAEDRGVRVYRLTAPKVVVPRVIVVTPGRTSID